MDKRLKKPDFDKKNLNLDKKPKKKLSIDKKIVIPITFTIVLILAITGIVLTAQMSGLAVNTTANSTFGEKPPATTSDLYIVNSTGDHFDRNGTSYYYVWGYVGNKAQLGASNVQITAKVFDEYNNSIAVNSTSPYRPEVIPAEGESYYYLGFEDPERKIVRYELNVAI